MKIGLKETQEYFSSFKWFERNQVRDKESLSDEDLKYIKGCRRMKKSYWAILAVGVLIYAQPSPLYAAAPTATVIPKANSEWQYVRDSSSKHFASEIFKEVTYDEDDLVNVYRMRKGVLTNDAKGTDKVSPDDAAIWNIFLMITDQDTLKKQILGFGTYKDPSDPTLGFVAKLGEKEQTWLLGINSNAADPWNKKWKRDIAIVLLHEYSHLITLNKSQLDIKKRLLPNCNKVAGYLVVRYGCTKKDSYLIGFVNAFWSKEEIATSNKAREEGTTLTFYGTRKASFVTDYAASGPTEDIAESFVDFVLRNKPTGMTIKDQKILFFYQYPELVTLRANIRANIQPLFI